MLPRPALLRASASARGDAEWLLALILLSLRVATLIPAALAAPAALDQATHPTRYLISGAGTLLFLAVLGSIWVRRRRADSVALGIADVAVAIGALILNATSFPPGMQIGTWAVWAPGYVVAVTPATVAWGTTRTTLGVAALLGTAYVATVSATSEAQVALSVYNAVGFLLLAAICSAGAALLRRFARDADEARGQAAAAAAALESERYRVLVHDTTGLLRLLAADDLPAQTREALREQALTESARLRAYVNEGGAMVDQSECALGPLIRGVLGSFHDLPIEQALMLGGNARLEPATAATLQRALVTVLHNVRRHAQAEQVVVHADARDGIWEVTVSDDGVGFDPAIRPLGFGLSTQVLAHATAEGIAVDLQSTPGVGTTVVFSGREQGAPVKRSAVAEQLSA